MRLLLIILIPTICFSQKRNDNVQAVYDSLDKVFYFNKVELETTNKYNFKPGQIPVYDNSTYEERINKLAARSPFNYRYNSVVQNYITMYSKRIKSTGTILALSELYFPLYEKYLNQYGLPLELKYLSIVESALNPTAVSPCGASGLWQFMFGTGKSYKLEINSYVDERFDPEKETIAACAYLRDLYKIYGQWDLAIAAYNCGPGNVNKGIKKAGGVKDFWAIYDYLPKETQGYVPAFIAASYICEYHEEHNIQKAKTQFLFDELDFIQIDYKASLKQISTLLSMDYKKLKYLNPKYITGVVPGDNSIVVVPKEKALDWIDIENYLAQGKLPPKKKKPVESLPIDNNQTTAANPTKTEPSKQKNLDRASKLPVNAFGTVFSKRYQDFSSNNKASVTETKQVDDFTKKLDDSKSYLCVSNGNQTLTNGSIMTLRAADDLFYSNIFIPKNSILKARASFKKESIILTITSALTPDGERPVSIVSEIYEKPGAKYILEDGYSILLKI